MNPAPPVTRTRTTRSSDSGPLRLGHVHHVLAVAGLRQPLPERVAVGRGDEAHPHGDLLEAGDPDALPVLQHPDVLPASSSDSWVPVSSQAKPRPRSTSRALPRSR